MAVGADNKVKCDGGGGPLGHPVVYLTFGERTQLNCSYCGKSFEKAAAPQAPSAE